MIKDRTSCGGANSRRCRGVTLLEILVVIAIITVLAVLALPALENARKRARQAACTSNLHQVGVALSSFMHDHQDTLPQFLAISEGGVREYLFDPRGQLYVPSPNTFRIFQILSNYIDTPKVLVCPADRRAAASLFGQLNNSTISYFASAPVVWAGDRNIRFAPGGVMSWSAEMHEFRGNLLYNDGHVEQLRNAAGELSRAWFATNLPLVFAPYIVPSTPTPQQNLQAEALAKLDRALGGGTRASAGSAKVVPAPTPIAATALALEKPASTQAQNAGPAVAANEWSRVALAGPSRGGADERSTAGLELGTNLPAASSAPTNSLAPDRPNPDPKGGSVSERSPTPGEGKAPPQAVSWFMLRMLVWILMALALITALELLRRRRSRRNSGATSRPTRATDLTPPE